jgi:asparagine synthase (glutamine-hydrolysing)
MCGIAGIIQAGTGAFDQLHIKQMTDTLAHRGPDGEGFWQSPGKQVLFGHRRLAIIDPGPAAAQPMHYRDRYTIVYNGEIYNYLELRQELQKQGYHFSTRSDTEVILAAYDYYGEECVEQFDGMFSLAIWDEEEKEFFAARDRFGEKPFFYTLHSGHFYFASEMKAFWAAGIPKKATLKMLFNFITIGYTDNPANPAETFFENIFKLPAASRLYYDPATRHLEISKYWEIDPSRINENISDEQAIEKFNELFTKSVNKRFRSDQMVGTSLSGGLDSSSIIAYSHDLRSASNSHTCLTAIFPGYEKNESGPASKVAASFGLHHFTTTMAADGLVDDLQKLIDHQEEPFGSSSIYAQYKVYELARQHGIRSLLDGQGADEILAGYPRYYKWYWQELFIHRRLARSRELKYARQNGVREKFGFNNMIASLLPEFASVFLEQQYLLHALQHEGLTKEFTRAQSKEAYYTAPSVTGLNDALFFSTFTHGLEELLRYADRNSMAHGCEIRLPYLDHQLVEFVFNLPSSFKIRQGWTKWLLRKAVDPRLPSEIAWRKDKIGFEPPQFEWMQNPRLQQLIRSSRQKLVDEKILQPTALAKPLSPSNAYDAAAYDWRYLLSGLFI